MTTRTAIIDMILRMPDRATVAEVIARLHTGGEGRRSAELGQDTGEPAAEMLLATRLGDPWPLEETNEFVAPRQTSAGSRRGGALGAFGIGQLMLVIAGSALAFTALVDVRLMVGLGSIASLAGIAELARSLLRNKEKKPDSRERRLASIIQRSATEAVAEADLTRLLAEIEPRAVVLDGLAPRP